MEEKTDLVAGGNIPAGIDRWMLAPLIDEIEVSLFGPGKGECVLVHLGGGKWMVVDSCLDDRKVAAPLAYLESIGVAPDAIELVVASHWHDDHIGGLGQVVKAATHARFFCSNGLEIDEFFMVVAAAAQRPMMQSTSGVSEFGAVIEVLESRSTPLGWAMVDRILHSTASVKVHSLSPSDMAVTESRRLISAAWASQQSAATRLAVPRPERNPSAIVLHVQIGAVSLLLCSDLETDRDPAMGWLAVVDAHARPTELADFVKVAHHGSGNGHEARVWAEMLGPQPYAALTPYLSGSTPIPRPADIARLRALTPNLFVTRRPGVQRSGRDWRAQKMAEEATNWIASEPRSAGALRFRRPIDASSEWQVSMSGTAEQVA